jgi:H+/Cl- antiporter ClcA
VEDLLRRLGSLRLDSVALFGTVLAALLVLLAVVAAFASGSFRPSAVGATVAFLLAVAAGLYASRLGAPGRSD